MIVTMHLWISLFTAGLFVILVCIPANGFVSIDPVGNHGANNPLTISGVTNISPGDELLIVVYPVNQTRSIKGVITSGSAGKVTIREGHNGNNTWSFTVGPSDLLPDRYKVIVSANQYDAEDTAVFTVLEKTPATQASAQPVTFLFAGTVIALAINEAKRYIVSII
jgi:hypothetical protein